LNAGATAPQPERSSGAAAMRLLVLLRFKGRLRALARGMRQPKRLIMTLGGVALVSFWIWVQGRSTHSTSFIGGAHQDVFLGAFLMFFPIMSMWAAARQGLIVYSPEEIHFLFPDPVRTRTLLETHLTTNCVKSLSAAFFFALFVRPENVSFPWAVLAYGIYLAFVVCLQAAVDVGCIGMDVAARRRRARMLVGGILLVIGSGVALAASVTQGTGVDPATGDPRVGGMDLMRWAVIPAQPFIALIQARGLTGSGPMAAALNLGGVLALIAALAITVLRFRGDVRESSHATSATVAEKMKAIRRGKMFQDAPKETTAGSTLPMLPRLGGAGIHAWRQLSVLRRARKSYVLLIFMALAMGIAFGIIKHNDPIAVAGVMLGVLSFAGPMYVQCDFRSDYESLAWMRSFPTPPGVLAAGQLLSSALVLYVMQVVMAGWVVLVCPAEQRLAWIGVFVMLPVFNLLQLSVWNGAHLIHPIRPATAAGTPGIAQMLRVYLVMLGVFFTLFLAVAIAAGFGTLTWWLLDRVAGLGPVTGVWIVTGLVALLALCTVTSICIWCVGRIFIRIDPNIDLAD
jgi:hypothetical protein